MRFRHDINAIFFDAVGTLIHPDPPAAEVYAATGRRFGSRLGVQEIRLRFARAFARQEEIDRHNDLRTSEEREVRRWREIVAEVLDDVAEPECCFLELYQHFARPEAWRGEPEAAPVFKELAGRGMMLGLASNYDFRLRSVLAGRPELTPARHVVLSAAVGWRKPAPEFFAAVCRVVGLPAGRILFVGDNRHNDYDGAKAAGLQAVLLDPQGRAADGVRRVASLGELLEGSARGETGP